MFYLRGRGGGGDCSNEEDSFGWWLSDTSPKSAATTSVSERGSRSGSVTSMLSCLDTDDTGENYTLAREGRREEDNDRGQEGMIELSQLGSNGELDLEQIEEDAASDKETLSTAGKTSVPVGRTPDYPGGACYTPERLVRSQEYRILTPSPRYALLTQGKLTPMERECSRKSRRCRRRLSYLIDPRQVGASQLRALFDLSPTEMLLGDPVTATRTEGDTTGERDQEAENTSGLGTDETSKGSIGTRSSISKRSSCDALNGSWRCLKSHSSSLEDTSSSSGIQSNDWSTETHTDAHNRTRPVVCLCEELAIASANPGLVFPQEHGPAINEVVSILEALETEPEKAAVLLDEDRFCDSGSSHDQLTRLALAIETDANVPGVLEDPDRLVLHLRRKVEKLQLASKDIYRDIRSLRKSFQCDEKKMAVLSSNASKLREDVHEMRYLDDLLNLLRGELERISNRNWPFVLGHTEFHSEEMNLIV